MKRRKLTALVSLLAVIAATTLLATRLLPGTGPEEPCGPARVSRNISLTVSRRENNALIADATLNIPSPAATFVEYGNDDNGWLRSPTSSPAATQSIPLLRLQAEASYEARAFVLTPGGCPDQVAVASFTTGKLPPQLAVTEYESVGEPTAPLLLLDHRPRDARSNTRWMVIMTPDGRPVWYHQIPNSIVEKRPSRSLMIMERRANGNFLLMMESFGFDELTPDDRLVRRIEVADPDAWDLHHDFVELPDDQVLFIAADERTVDDSSSGGAPDLLVRGDAIYRFELGSGEATRLWSTFDLFDPVARPTEWRGRKANVTEDWTHSNTLSIGPRGNVVLSIRHLDSVVSLAPDLRSVEWILGGAKSSFAFPDSSDRFHGQHTARELPGGRVLLFDNGNYRPDGSYSRGLELQLDFANMTARKVWEYRHQPDTYSSSQGSATRMANGNTLVNFGFNDEGPGDPLVLAEVDPAGTAVWTQLLRWRVGRSIRYRAELIDSIGGERRVEPTEIAPA